jgi:hypothetical protein
LQLTARPRSPSPATAGGCLAVDVGRHHAGALGREALHDGQAHALGCTRNEYHLVGKLHAGLHDRVE